MIFAYADASALLKRYYVEIGSAEMNHLFHRLSLERVFVLAVGYAEVASVLKRQRNAGRLKPRRHQLALRRLRAEVGLASSVNFVSVDGRLADTAIRHINSHSINSTDAILLQSALEIATSLKAAGDNLILVASDQRLLRAANAEGLDSYNPETQSAADLDALLGP